MNIAMQLLARLGGYREEQQADAGAGGKGAFNPTEAQQGVGLHDKARELQAAQEQDGGAEKQPDAQGDKKEPDPSQPPATEEKSQEQQPADDTPYVYNGVEVTVTEDPEVAAMFVENKEKLGDLTLDKVTREIYSEKGLSAPTKQKLYEAFGKPAVDMYLKGLDAHNKAQMASASAFETQYTAMANEATGGKLNDVLKWANDNLKPQEYQDYADLVNSGDIKTAKLALSDLYRRSGLGASAKEEATSARATGMKPTSTASTEAENGPISQAQYMKAITTREYHKDPASWDARRRAGMAAGI